MSAEQWNALTEAEKVALTAMLQNKVPAPPAAKRSAHSWKFSQSYGDMRARHRSGSKGKGKAQGNRAESSRHGRFAKPVARLHPFGRQKFQARQWIYTDPAPVTVQPHWHRSVTSRQRRSAERKLPPMASNAKSPERALRAPLPCIDMAEWTEPMQDWIRQLRDERDGDAQSDTGAPEDAVYLVGQVAPTVAVQGRQDSARALARTVRDARLQELQRHTEREARGLARGPKAIGCTYPRLFNGNSCTRPVTRLPRLTVTDDRDDVPMSDASSHPQFVNRSSSHALGTKVRSPSPTFPSPPQLPSLAKV